MRRFLKQVNLPAGTKYAILTTEGAPQPDKKTGRMPTEEEIARWQHVIPIMNELLQAKGMVEVAEDKVYVTGIGMVTPLGVDTKSSWEALLQGRSGIAPITAFDTERFGDSVRFCIFHFSCHSILCCCSQPLCRTNWPI